MRPVNKYIAPATSEAEQPATINHQHPSTTTTTPQRTTLIEASNRYTTTNTTMLDPTQVVDAFRSKTSTFPGGILPTATTTHVSPIPTVVPDVPSWEKIHHAGATTLCKNQLDNDPLLAIC